MNNFIAIGNSEPTPDNLPDEIKKIINDGKREAGFNPDGTPLMSPTDTNQASEDEMRENIDALLERWRNILTHKGDGNGDEYYQSEVIDDIQEIIRTEKLKLLDEVIHQSTVNLKSARAVAGWAELRKEQLGANQ